MKTLPERISNRPILISSSDAFYTSLWVLGITAFIVFAQGIHNHRSLFENSLLTTSILSIAFSIFIAIGLYRGVKLKNDVKRLNEKLDSGLFSGTQISPDLPGIEIGDDIGGIIVGILLWILTAILIIVLAWLFSAIVVSTVILFMAMLYWIFYRALRLVFKKSHICRNNLPKSIGYALLYTVLYNIWIYGVVIGMHYLR